MSSGRSGCTGGGKGGGGGGGGGSGGGGDTCRLDQRLCEQ